jgi:hypothetical protein
VFFPARVAARPVLKARARGIGWKNQSIFLIPNELGAEESRKRYEKMNVPKT